MSDLMSGLPISLASSSPRRRRLISCLGVPFNSCAPIFEEVPPHQQESPIDYARRMAVSKALSVVREEVTSSLVIGSDTIVVLDGIVFGKPADLLMAESMLNALRGRAHRVVTAVALATPELVNPVIRTSSALIMMRDYLPEEVAEYISTGDPMDKAGAYAIQDSRFNPVSEFEGCYSGAVGLPLCLLSKMLCEVGIEVDPICCGTIPDSRVHISKLFDDGSILRNGETK